MDKVAVIGAGISGLALANRLKNHFEVVVFEKSRGYGGRVATRRFGEFIFDHGAQFFKAKTEEFPISFIDIHGISFLLLLNHTDSFLGGVLPIVTL